MNLFIISSSQIYNSKAYCPLLSFSVNIVNNLSTFLTFCPQLKSWTEMYKSRQQLTKVDRKREYWIEIDEGG